MSKSTKFVNNSAECPFRKEPQTCGNCSNHYDFSQKAYCWVAETDCYFDGGMKLDICPLMKGVKVQWEE